MQVFASILASVATLSLCTASTIVLPRDASREVLAAEALVVPLPGAKRSLPNSPSGGYAPAVVPCPANRPTIREATSLSPNETAWLQLRRNATVDPMITWLTRMNISGFDASTYINTYRNNATALPNIGIAVSGGGYRALMNGAGFVAAADNRTINSTNAGQIGGLLQASTYLTGLSGGGWLVGSIYSNNFSSVQDLRDGSSGSNVWKFDNSILEGPNGDGIQLLSTADYFSIIESEVSSKKDAGYETSITDYWGRALSFQLVNTTDGGPSYTFSSIALQDFFTSGSVPMPILVTDGRAPNTTIVSLNSTVYEFSPFELGSWDPTTYGFAPLEYIGSNFLSGIIPDDGSCVRGFDQAGFMMGTSSTLFNEVFVLQNSSSIPSFLTNLFTSLLNDIGFSNNDIAQYQPNPFYGFNNATNRDAQSNQLTLVDGGEDGQNIPLYPLIQPQRGLDVIFAVDSSADVNNWPNGTSLVATYQRSLNKTIENGTAFPSIPDQNTFVNLGLNNHPTMFGCNISNITGTSFTTSGYVPPLVVYVPNTPYITFSNVSTFDLQYNDTQRNLIIRNGYDVATQGNGTIDAQWPTCMGCAVMQRSWYKTGTTIPSVCQTCFDRYCWNGTVDSSTPASYYPSFKSKAGAIKSAASSVRVGVYMSALAVALAVAMLLS